MSKIPMKWRHGWWHCPGCGSKMRLTGPAPATWRHYTPRRDWNHPLAKPQQLVLWGELSREPCALDVCPCKTAGPDRDGIGGKTR